MGCEVMTSRRHSAFCAVSLLMLLASVTVSEAAVTLESLNAVVEQQAAVIQTLTAQVTSQQAGLLAQSSVTDSLHEEVTSLKNDLHVLQTKVDVTSSAVAFFARLSHDQDSINDGVALSPHQTLVFNDAVTNAGNAYNTSTGVFTAPVAGTYAFFLSAMGTIKHGDIFLAIIKNGATLNRVHAEGSNDLFDQGSSLVSTQLIKGDRVWVRQNEGDAVRAGWYTVFTGYLLQAQ